MSQDVRGAMTVSLAVTLALAVLSMDAYLLDTGDSPPITAGGAGPSRSPSIGTGASLPESRGLSGCGNTSRCGDP